MRQKMRFNHVAAWFGAVLFFGSAAAAQQQTKPAANSARTYQISREVSLHGTVVSFIANSAKPPIGPHVVVQTTSGQVDVHLGDARTLQASHLTLATGDTIRVVGENVAYGEGTQFFARLVQKGNQTVAVRSMRGLPLRPMNRVGKAEAGAL
jgi:hypothetical protein